MSEHVHTPGVTKHEIWFRLTQPCACEDPACPLRKTYEEFKARLRKGADDLAKKLGVEVR